MELSSKRSLVATLSADVASKQEDLRQVDARLAAKRSELEQISKQLERSAAEDYQIKMTQLTAEGNINSVDMAEFAHCLDPLSHLCFAE